MFVGADILVDEDGFDEEDDEDDDEDEREDGDEVELKDFNDAFTILLGTNHLSSNFLKYLFKFF